MIDSRVRALIQPLFDAASAPLIKCNVSPNALTVAAFVIGLASAAALTHELKLVAVFLLWFSGFLDVIDGTVARKSGRTTQAGAFMDLVFDRIVESAVVIGFYICLPQHALVYLLFLASVIFNFSTFLISAILFKNEGEKSMHYDVGIMERTETFILFSGAMLIPSLTLIIFTLAVVLITVTGVIRFYRVIKYSNI